MNYIIWEKKHKNIIEMNEYYNYSFITLTNKKLLSLSVSVNCEVLAWDLSCIQLHNVSQIPIFNENTEWWLPEFRVTPNSVSPSFLIWSVCFTVTLDWRLLYLPASWTWRNQFFISHFFKISWENRKLHPILWCMNEKNNHKKYSKWDYIKEMGNKII